MSEYLKPDGHIDWPKVRKACEKRVAQGAPHNLSTKGIWAPYIQAQLEYDMQPIPEELVYKGKP